MQFLTKKIICLAIMSRFSKVNLENKLKLLKNIQMDKSKVFHKIYQLPEFTRNFMDVIPKRKHTHKLNSFVFYHIRPPPGEHWGRSTPETKNLENDVV